MRLGDYLEFSFSNLWKRKLRTFLTAFGVTIGIGALVSMVSFGVGMQKNVTEGFQSLELFNSITVLPSEFMAGEGRDPDEAPKVKPPSGPGQAVLDEAAVAKIVRIRGVETAFPEIRFPAVVRFQGQEEFRLIQAVPALTSASKLVRFTAGRGFVSDEEEALVVSSSFLRRLGVRDPRSALGKKMVLSSLAFDSSLLSPLDLAAALGGSRLPFTMENYELTIVGITETATFAGPAPMQSDVFIPLGVSGRMKRLPFSNVWDLFRGAKEGRIGYSAVNVRLSSPAFVESVKKEISALGFGTFALIDQFREVQKAFLVMNMILAAVGMIAIVVASLGIINTMVMSILERYAEIGIMKAVGAGDRDIRKIFFFESSAIGLLGGVFGLALGWAVSGVINRIVNYFLAKQAVPFIQYFRFPAWLCLGAIAFSVAVSLVAGIYPAMRAARVDPVRALRHD
ncbi:MAG: FtsX-like permease family protein [Acidobacteriota bacterium]